MEHGFLHVVTDAADLRFLNKPVCQLAGQHVRDPRRENRDHTLLHLVVHNAPRSLSADRFAPVRAIEAFELGAEEGTLVEPCVAVNTEQHLLRASGVQIVLHHEIE